MPPHTQRHVVLSQIKSTAAENANLQADTINSELQRDLPGPDPPGPDPPGPDPPGPDIMRTEETIDRELRPEHVASLAWAFALIASHGTVCMHAAVCARIFYAFAYVFMCARTCTSRLAFMHVRTCVHVYARVRVCST